MLVGGHHVNVAFEARNGAGGDACVGVLVTLVTVGRHRIGDQLAPVYHWVHIDEIGVYAVPALGNQQVGYHDTRALEPVGQVEELRHGVEGVQSIEGSGDQALIVALAGSEHLPQIALLGLGRHAGGRAGTHHVDVDDRDFHHACRADGLCHQGEAAAGGGTHGPDAGMCRANDHVGNADLVFDLPNHDAQVAGVGGHPVQDARGRAHGVGRVELHARSGAAHGDGFVARPHCQRLAALGQRLREGAEV